MPDMDPYLALIIAAASDSAKAERIAQIKAAEAGLDAERAQIEQRSDSIRTEAAAVAQGRKDLERDEAALKVKADLIEDEKKRFADTMAAWEQSKEQWEQLRKQVEDQHSTKDAELEAKRLELGDRETSVASREAQEDEVDALEAKLQAMIEGAKKWLEAVDIPEPPPPKKGKDKS